MKKTTGAHCVRGATVVVSVAIALSPIVIATYALSGDQMTGKVGTSVLGRQLTKEWRDGPLRSASHYLTWGTESRVVNSNGDKVFGWRSELTGLWYRQGKRALLKVKHTRFKPSRCRRFQTVAWLASMTDDYVPFGRKVPQPARSN